MKFIKNLKSRREQAAAQSEEPATMNLSTESEEIEEVEEEEVVTLGTKIKVVAALAVVGFATYVAYWVQEPTDFQAQLIEPDMAMEEDAMMEEEAMMENTPEETMMVEAPPSNSALMAQNVTTQNETKQEVAIIDFTFTPANITVQQGTTVEWTNLDVGDHTITSDFFSSEVLNPGDSFSFTFEEEGTYEYFCSIHPQMQGKITVTGGEASPVQELPETNEPDNTIEANEESLPTETLSPELLTTETSTPTIVTIDPQELLEEEPEAMSDETVILTLSEDASKVRSAASIDESAQLAKSGPEDILYVGFFFGILYMNRRRLFPNKG